VRENSSSARRMCRRRRCVSIVPRIIPRTSSASGIFICAHAARMVYLSALPVLKYAVLLNPLTYVSEGLRAALTPSVPHMPVAAIVGALLALTAFFLWLGLRAFRRRAIG
jgi:hypothetical protein